MAARKRPKAKPANRPRRVPKPKLKRQKPKAPKKQQKRERKLPRPRKRAARLAKIPYDLLVAIVTRGTLGLHEPVMIDAYREVPPPFTHGKNVIDWHEHMLATDKDYSTRWRWQMAAKFSDAHDLPVINDERTRRQILEAAQAKGNGAITLLRRLSSAYEKGSKEFNKVARKIAEEFDREVRDVYTLWLSPQLEMGD